MITTINITKLFKIRKLLTTLAAYICNRYMKNWLLITCIAIVTIGQMACKDIEKIKKSTDQNYKLAKANEFYDKKKWEEANILYEDLLTVFKGTKQFEDLYYKYTYSFYNMNNFLAASYHFKNFSDIFPNSARHDECEYQTCMCLYKMSPESTLDQSSTVKAIGALQTFVNTHPESPKVAEANKIIDEARKKLEKKDGDAAALYFKISEFRSAGTAYASLIKKYPDSDLCDYYQLMVAKSNYNYARLSIPAKQEERFNIALVDYNDFLSNYPNSKLKSEADKLKTTIFADIKKIQK
jgi:outer membrane protein assembly factor BamD